MNIRLQGVSTLVFSIALAFSSSSFAQETSFSHYGGAGGIKTRSARMATDSTLTSTIAWHQEQQRYGLSFQAAPWLETSFSYSGFNRSITNDTFDRQFDIKARLIRETTYFPSVAVGLQDFLGTGVFSGEYIVASKRLGPLDLSFGVGWGALAGRSVASNPFASLDGFDQRNGFSGQGGEVNFGQFFHGEDIGVFGSVIADTPIEGLKLIAEYDSDDNSAVYDLDDNSPFNLGITYNPTPGIQLGASYLSGDEFALSASFSTETKSWAKEKPTGRTPFPFSVRELLEDDGGEDELIAPVQPQEFTPVDFEQLPGRLHVALEEQGLELLTFERNEDTVRLVLRNDTYRSYVKAAGRTARVMSGLTPAQIENFQIVFDQTGLQTASFVLNRSELEKSAFESGYSFDAGGVSSALAKADLAEALGTKISFHNTPLVDWYIGPELRLNIFDPDDPLRAQIDAVAKGTAELLPGVFVSANVSKGLIGNFDNTTRRSDSVLPHVRSDFAIYDEQTDIAVNRLAGEYFFNIAPDVYGKVTGGLLERMFGGVGGEVLWRPAESRVAIGFEGFYAKQRDFDTLFDFQDYDVLTGHASVYYDTPYNDWNLALHAGRYLAGDWGATFEASRRFENGWEVGAFATFTDVPFEDFGEGSFDKGIYVTVPLDWGLPNDTQSRSEILLRPLSRDGGARLDIENRLFRMTEPASRADMEAQWDYFSH